jgi:hypothetical protein
MAKIERYNGNLKAFASEALGTERTVFGDTVQSDVLSTNINADFLRGWGIVGVNEAPKKQDFAGLGFTLGQLIAYLHQTGVADWNGLQQYQIGSFANRAGVLYVCKTLDHISATVPESDATNWRLIDATDVAYDNSASGLVAENPQDAIDEIVSTYYTKTASDGRFVAIGEGVTGTATFANSTNNISLTGVGGLSGLEVGDVIQVSDSVSNNTEFTIEVITDANNVIVNQAHAGGSSSKSLVNETATAGVTVKILSNWYSAPTGLGQGWVSVTSSRAASVTYTNSTNRPIQLSAGFDKSASSPNFTIDSALTLDGPSQGTNDRSIWFAIIPVDGAYRVTNVTNVNAWNELR